MKTIREISKIKKAPKAEETVLIRINNKQGIKDYVGPIKDLRLIYYEEEIHIRLPWKIKTLMVPLQIIIDYTNDPTSDHAGSWVSLTNACMRFDARIKETYFEEGETWLVGELKHLKLRASAPDR